MSLKERLSKYLKIIAAKTNQQLIGHFVGTEMLMHCVNRNIMHLGGEREPGRQRYMRKCIEQWVRPDFGLHVIWLYVYIYEKGYDLRK